MKSRAFLLVGLVCLIFLLVCSTMAAETSQDEIKAKFSECPYCSWVFGDEAKQADLFVSRGRCRYGCCSRGLFGRCRWCCKTANEAKAAEEAGIDVNGYGGGDGHGLGGHCRYGCCGGYGKYCRCCYDPEEAQALIENEN